MRDTEDELPAGPLSYWEEPSNDIRSNNVAKMALEVFSIPAMSADPECNGIYYYRYYSLL